MPAWMEDEWLYFESWRCQMQHNVSFVFEIIYLRYFLPCTHLFIDFVFVFDGIFDLYFLQSYLLVNAGFIPALCCAHVSLCKSVARLFPTNLQHVVQQISCTIPMIPFNFIFLSAIVSILSLFILVIHWDIFIRIVSLVLWPKYRNISFTINVCFRTKHILTRQVNCPRDISCTGLSYSWLSQGSVLNACAVS